MWGCIGSLRQQKGRPPTPSLYVRVYRREKPTAGKTASSLIICEGVSHWKRGWKQYKELPHYMWGCIDHILCIRYADGAPSLYVRVYQNWRNVMNNCRTLPHYMWGCIALITDLDDIYNAPSLYVRVYRRGKAKRDEHFSSLIICEGVSPVWNLPGVWHWFPHYMWGCIGCAGLPFH